MSAQPQPRIADYTAWLARERGLHFDGYEALWRWSTTDIAAFWQSLWDYFGIESPTPHHAVVESPVMPGARWFPGAQVNFARQALRHADALAAAGHPALVFQAEGMPEPVEVGWLELRRRVGAMAAQLRAAGVQRGDRVCAYLPNTPDAIVSCLACMSVGAIWSVCSPDMGPVAVLDRFRQIEPVVLVAVARHTWGGVTHDRSGVLREVVAGLPSLRHLVRVARAPGDAAEVPGPLNHRFEAWTAGDPGPWQPDWLPFDHPLWIVYSSGTTGLPKPIVHGHGGVMLEFLKGGCLHNDVLPTLTSGERFHWFSSTGWIMWNAQLGSLLGGTTVCLYDGNPGGPAGNPDWGTLWRFAAAAKVSWFGAGAAFYASCLKAGVLPMQQGDLSRLRAIGSTGSPLSEDGYRWIWAHCPRPGGEPIWINAISGGTDFAGAFVAGNRMLPVVAGEMQCRCLGAAVAAFDEQGHELIGEVGELVCTQPLPSMPLFFWGDTDNRRYAESYFDMFPGVWRHGDWIRLVPREGAAGAVIYGRSDATINRHGIRMGTAELYRAVEAQPEVLDSLVVDLEYLGRESWMPLFVVLREGLTLDAALQQRLRAAIKAALSARHVPNEIVQVAAIPRTLSGKKMELPVKKLLLGADPAQVLNRDAMANAGSIDAFVAYARGRSRA
jgi:acetoacetyl-CoA synthetase